MNQNSLVLELKPSKSPPPDYPAGAMLICEFQPDSFEEQGTAANRKNSAPLARSYL